MTTPEERILVFDPSSTCCGWCVGWREKKEAKCTTAGLLYPSPKSGGQGEAHVKLRRRMRSIAPLVVEQIAAWSPAVIVLEVPSMHIDHQSRRRGARGVTSYARTAGYLEAVIDQNCGDAIVAPITQREWTQQGRFAMKKSNRGLIAGSIWGGYSDIAHLDKGFDAADAICLLDWFVRHRLRDKKLL